MTVGVTRTGPVDTEWRGLVRLGAAAAVFVVVMIPFQAAVFILSPPPSTVEGFFALFQENPLLGLLDLDLLLTLDYLVMVPFYLSLYVVVRRVAPAWGLLALVVGLFSLVLFVVSREATFSMWILSDQYGGSDLRNRQGGTAGSGDDPAHPLQRGHVRYQLHPRCGQHPDLLGHDGSAPHLWPDTRSRRRPRGTDHARPRERRPGRADHRNGVPSSHRRLVDTALPAPAPGCTGSTHRTTSRTCRGYQAGSTTLAAPVT